jgi:hypothetical protein
MPSADTVTREQLPAAGARQPDHVLDVGDRGRQRSDRGAIDRAASDCEEHDARGCGDDLESPRRVVLVWNPIAEGVGRQAEEDRLRMRPRERADRRAGRNVQRGDHQCRFQ